MVILQPVVTTRSWLGDTTRAELTRTSRQHEMRLQERVRASITGRVILAGA